MELKTARAIENIQNLSRQKNYEFQIKTSLKDDYEFTINPSTKYFRTENGLSRILFYGILKDAGGKSKVNIHLDTKDYGYLSIETGKFKGKKENLLYKKFGVRASGKQNIETGEIDTKSLSLLELIDYHPKFDSTI